MFIDVEFHYWLSICTVHFLIGLPENLLCDVTGFKGYFQIAFSTITIIISIIHECVIAQIVNKIFTINVTNYLYLRFLNLDGIHSAVFIWFRFLVLLGPSVSTYMCSAILLAAEYMQHRNELLDSDVH